MRVLTFTFYKIIVEEMFFPLGETAFRTDMVGKIAYYLLWRLIIRLQSQPIPRN